jgi:hypothetical protein
VLDLRFLFHLDLWVRVQAGRFFAGIAMSLLFSSFVGLDGKLFLVTHHRDPVLMSSCADQVCEHHKRGFDSARLSETFGYQTLGNGLVAGRLSSHTTDDG